MSMNRFLHIAGWKREGKWNSDEVMLDISVLMFVALVGSVIAYVYIG